MSRALVIERHGGVRHALYNLLVGMGIDTIEAGTVEEIEGNVLTLDALDGTKVRVVVSDQTTIQKMAQGTTSDISAGSTITVTGQKNTDGSIQATSIFITPVPTTPEVNQ